MLLIVAHHYVVNSGLTSAGGPIASNPLSAQSLFLLVFGAWGKTGINCFVLITGYFMCTANITAKKFIKLVGEVESYNILFFVLFLITGYDQFSWKGLLLAVFPISSAELMFPSCFLLFYLFIPFLNILIHNLGERRHFYLLALCIFMYVIIGTIPYMGTSMNYVSWFIVLYILSSFIRLYPRKIMNKCGLWGWLTLLSVSLSILSIVAMTWIGTKYGKMAYYFSLSDSNKFLAVSNAVCAFLFFKNWKMKRSKFINTVASSTFGVLMIHANSDAMRRWLWQDTLKNTMVYGSPYMYLHAVLSVLGIFVVCVFIDQARIHLLEKPLFGRGHDFSAWFRHIDRQICDRLHLKETR